MNDTSEKQCLGRFVRNAMKNLSWSSLQKDNLLEWLKEHYQEMPGELWNLLDDEDSFPRSSWKGIRTQLDRRVHAEGRAWSGTFEKNLQSLGDLFELDSMEMDILGLTASYYARSSVESLIDKLTYGKKEEGVAIMAALLGAKRCEIHCRLNRDSRLTASGLLNVDYVYSDFDDKFTVLKALRAALAPPHKDIRAMREALLGTPAKPGLSWEDFEHLERRRDLLARLLTGATKNSEPGVNVLVYGPPGTGKTELCKAMAARLKMNLYPVGETDTGGGEPTRLERVGNLSMTQALLANQKDALVLFDEMEDAFPSDQSISRVFAHRLLETNPRPVLWACNRISEFDPALLRRMTMVVEIDVPGPEVRRRIWEKVLSGQRVKLSKDAVGTLCNEFAAPPALAANAAKAARLAGGDFEDVRLLVAGMGKVLTGKEIPFQAATVTRFNPELICCDTNPASLVDRLADAGTRRFSLCLSGPPGTGKSAYARYVAEKLGMNVIQKRASDLLMPYVGESEQNIAQAFAQARAQDAMLIFDEADSLLSDRASAVRNWEISQVNEMLTWMENHPLPFVCTTNFAKHLDPASLRRFVFKMEFGFLTPEKVRKAFSVFFGAELPQECLADLRGLTPGDFALVATKAKLMATANDPLELVRMLRLEALAKPGARAGTIGFCSHVHSDFSQPRNSLTSRACGK